MRLIKRISLMLALLAGHFIAFAQNNEQELLKSARRGDAKAMYELGISLLGKEESDNAKESYSWIHKSADKDYAPSQAMLAYFYRNGIGTDKDLIQAWQWGQKASTSGDGFAAWLLAQVSKDRGFEQNTANDYLHQAFEREYPFAKLLYAKAYAEGNNQYGINRNEAKSKQILQELSEYGLPEALSIWGVQIIDQPGQAFRYIKQAADKGYPKAMGLLAGMYYHGEGVNKSIPDAFNYYEKAAELKDPFGMEGLADCYRIGVGTGVFQERAFNLYKELNNPSPRVMYILGCYYNEGISTERDFKKAANLFEKSASKGNVFAQATLGIAYYDGSAPFEEKDFDKAYSYLTSTIGNEDFYQLPDYIAARVYDYMARCVRFGRGGAVKSKEESDKLQEKADALNEGASSKSFPFALVDLISFPESVEACGISWDMLNYQDILESITFDYPKDYLDKAPEPVAVEPQKPVVEEKPKPEPKPASKPASVKPQPKKTAVPKAQKPSTPKSGRLAVMIEAAPYCFAPTTVVSSRDGNTYWLKGSAIDISASAGWLTDSGLFIGGGVGFESFSAGRMSVIQGFVDARYFLDSDRGLFFGARGGVAYGSPEYGIGITAAGMLGYKISLGGNTGLVVGLKAGINSFTDDNKSMGNIVGPFIGISF